MVSSRAFAIASCAVSTGTRAPQVGGRVDDTIEVAAASASGREDGGAHPLSNGLSGFSTEVSPAALRRCDRTGSRDGDVDERADAAAHRPRLHLQWSSRHWEDDDRAHPGDGAELPEY